MMRRAFLVGYYGAGNLGDEAIRESIEHGAAARGWVIESFAVRRDIADPRAVRMRRSPLSYLRAIARSELVVIGGGGILKDEGLGLPLELFVTTLAARLLGRRVAILAVGVGPFYSRLGRLLIAGTARLANSRSVRDQGSVAALGQMRVSATLSADPVFAPGRPWPDGPRAGDRAAGVARPAAARPVLLMAMRPWFHTGGRGSRQMDALRDAVAGAVTRAVSDGWQVRLTSLYWPRDHLLAAEVAQRAAVDVQVDDQPLSWDLLVAAAESADAVVAMRFHALAAAIVAGRPALAIGYEPKVQDLAARVGLPCILPDAPGLADELAAAVAALRDAAATSPPGTPRPGADAALGELQAAAQAGLDLAFGNGGG